MVRRTGALPDETFARMTSFDDLLGLIRAELGDPETVDSVASRLMIETLREAERDPVLRDRMGRLMSHYRALIADLVRREQEQGHASGEIPPEGFATLLAAVGDGLLLHALLDPDLDVLSALEALDVLVRSLSAQQGKTR